MPSHIPDALQRSAGATCQATLSQRMVGWLADGLGACWLYGRGRGLSPAPFGAYLASGDGLAVASASPERFLRLDARGRVSTRPIKGTRPRGNTPEQDLARAQALLDQIAQSPPQRPVFPLNLPAARLHHEHYGRKILYQLIIYLQRRAPVPVSNS